MLVQPECEDHAQSQYQVVTQLTFVIQRVSDVLGPSSFRARDSSLQNYCIKSKKLRTEDIIIMKSKYGESDVE